MSFNHHLIFLLEEPSMKEMLKVILPKIIPDEITYKCIPHDGKQDLEKSIPKKLKALKNVKKFIIVRDKDSGDCIEIKQKLSQLCQQANRPDTLIRIPCHELEAWYLGDLAAVEQGLKMKKLAKLQNKQKYRSPDSISSPKQELKRIAPNYQPISGSKAIATHLNLSTNTSVSFNVFLEGIDKVIKDITTSNS